MREGAEFLRRGIIVPVPRLRREAVLILEDEGGRRLAELKCSPGGAGEVLLPVRWAPGEAFLVVLAGKRREIARFRIVAPPDPNGTRIVTLRLWIDDREFATAPGRVQADPGSWIEGDVVFGAPDGRPRAVEIELEREPVLEWEIDDEGFELQPDEIAVRRVLVPEEGSPAPNLSFRVRIPAKEPAGAGEFPLTLRFRGRTSGGERFEGTQRILLSARNDRVSGQGDNRHAPAR